MIQINCQKPFPCVGIVTLFYLLTLIVTPVLTTTVSAQIRQWPEDVMDDILLLREILTAFNDQIDIEDPRILAKHYPNRDFSDFDRNRDRRFDLLDLDLAIVQFIHDPFDFDQDGIPGFYELECAFARSRLRLDPANAQTIGGKADGNLDCDGDRYTNLEEMEFETNPLDPNDVPECRVDGNCDAHEVCERGRCVPAQSCEDLIENQDETDTDCGGQICDPCGEGYKCGRNGDCENEECIGGMCQIYECPENLVNLDQIPQNGCEYFCPADPEGPEERCDLQDNDCDGLFDEAFDFENDPTRCGGCFGTCPEVENALRGCEAGICGISECENNWHNIDQELANGCEYFCEPDPRGPEEYCDNRDNDCDGRFDEDPACNLETGFYQTCVISDDRTEARCWGNLSFASGGPVYSDDPGEMGDNIFRLHVGPGREILKVSMVLGLLCALLDDHQIYCQGDNYRMQGAFGDNQDHYFAPGTALEETFRIDLGDGNVIVDVQLGYENSCALFQDGRIKCWGYLFTDEQERQRRMGTQLEDMGNNLPYIDLGGRVLSIAAENSAGQNGYHACALLEGGEVKCWGSGNTQGQLGQGDTEPRVLPNQLGENLPPVDLGPVPAVAVEVGQINSCAILQNGELKCWGRFPPQFRDGEPPYFPGDDPDEMGENLMPVFLGEGAVVKQIELVHSVRSCALLESGEVRCWGPVRGGLVGYLNPETANEVGDYLGDEPGEMEAFVQPLDFGVDEPVTAISMKYLHACATFESQRVKCWGYNSVTSLGYHFLSRNEYVGDDLNELAELPFVLLEGCNEHIDCPSQVCDCPEGDCEAGGGPFECAAATCEDGIQNQNEIDVDCGGECGLCQNRQQCNAAEDCASGTCDEGRCVEAHCTNEDVDGNESDLNCGGGCMPCPDRGACEDNSDCASEECVEDACQITECPVNEHNLDGLPQNGCEYFCEPDPRGPEEYCDGRDNDCDGLFDEEPECGLSTGYENTCVIRDDRSEVSCWGTLRFLEGSPYYSDDPGEMGDNIFRLHVGEDREILKVSMSAWLLCALLDDHQIYCQGRSLNGRGGFGDSENHYFEPSTPLEETHQIDLGDDNTVVDFSLAPDYACALFQDGRTKCWGDGILDEAGEIIGRVGATPESMGNNLPYVDLGGRAISVSVDNDIQNNINRHHACALLEGGFVKCWGENEYGQLGQGDTLSRFLPEQLGENLPPVDLGQVHAVAVKAGRDNACAILENGELKCWGFTRQYFIQEDNPFMGDEPEEMGANLAPWFLGEGAVIRQIETADRKYCALLSSGEVRCWGVMSRGIVGYYDPEVLDETGGYLGDDPVEMEDVIRPLDFGVNEQVTAISLKFLHACATFENQKVKCWGANIIASLGHHFLERLEIVEDEPGELANLPFVLLEGCHENIDCPSQVCDCPDGDCEVGGGPFECLEAQCDDGVQNQNEIDIDCGGECGLCADGQFCDFGEDCGSGVCQQNRCAFAHCFDGFLNEDETHTDCGGMDCLPCGVGLACGNGGDCDSDVCSLGECREASCGDGALSENETDVDCGGVDCGPCAVDAACLNGLDCDSRVCNENVCAAPTCDDGELNQDETDEDCGGATCDACEVGLGCQVNADCLSGICQSFMCREVSCQNGALDEGEEDIDCGGPCGDCPFEFDGVELGLAVCDGAQCPSVCEQQVPEGLECDEACQAECVAAVVGQNAMDIGEAPLEITVEENAVSAPILLSAKLVDIDENAPIAFDPGLQSDSERVVSPVQFGPSGQTFAEPLAIRVTLTEPLEPNTIHPLLELDEEAGMWRQAILATTGGPAFAIVDETGQNAIYAIDHFSIFAVEFDRDLYSPVNIGDVRYHFPGGLQRRDGGDEAALRRLGSRATRKEGYRYILRTAALRQDKETEGLLAQIELLNDNAISTYAEWAPARQTMEELFRLYEGYMDEMVRVTPLGPVRSQMIESFEINRSQMHAVRRGNNIVAGLIVLAEVAACFFDTYMIQSASLSMGYDRLVSFQNAITTTNQPLWNDLALRDALSELLGEFGSSQERMQSILEAFAETGECLGEGIREELSFAMTDWAYRILVGFDPIQELNPITYLMLDFTRGFLGFDPFVSPDPSFKAALHSTLLQTIYQEGGGKAFLGSPIVQPNPPALSYFNSLNRNEWQPRQMYSYMAEQNALLNTELLTDGDGGWLPRRLPFLRPLIEGRAERAAEAYQRDAELISTYEASIEEAWAYMCEHPNRAQNMQDMCVGEFDFCPDNVCVGQGIGPYCSNGILYQCVQDQGCMYLLSSANCPSGACDGQNACFDPCEDANCDDCQTCNGNGDCVADPDRAGNVCGNNGVCNANGTCDLCANLDCDANCEWCDQDVGICNEFANGSACGNWGECSNGSCNYCANHQCGECEYCDGNGNCRNRNNGTNCNGGTCQNGVCQEPVDLCENNNCDPNCERCNPGTGGCFSVNELADCGFGRSCHDGVCINLCAQVPCGPCEDCNPANGRCVDANEGLACGNNGTCRSGNCEEDLCEGNQCGECTECDPDTGDCVAANENIDCGRNGKCSAGVCDEDNCIFADQCRPVGETECYYRAATDETFFRTCRERAWGGCEHLAEWNSQECLNHRCDRNIGCLP